MPEIDVMAFGAHPDDIELGCGGTLVKLTEAGRRVVLIDLVRGELGTRGTPKIRREESAKAAEILGATERENLELEEGNITGIVVHEDFAYVTVNFSGRIYRVNLFTGKAEVFAEGLDYPRDIELWHGSFRN